MMGHGVILEVLLVTSQICGTDWCKESCGWLKQKHVKCAFHIRTYNDLCPSIKSVITPKERRDILLYHNNLREDVAVDAKRWRVSNSFTRGSKRPSMAGDMRQMVWDYDLEENALIYASQCTVMSHRPYDCANTADLPLVHMNKYDNSLTSLNMEEVFKEWVLENRKPIHLFPFTSEYRLIKSYVPGPWDDFFIVIFSRTSRLGCAKVICNCHQHKPLHKVGSVACLYGPVPNLSTSGYPVYEVTNEACSSCPTGTACHQHSTWPHLCANGGDPRIPLEIPNKNADFTLSCGPTWLLPLTASFAAHWSSLA